MDLGGRAAIVTGGAGGLGSATVKHLASAEMKVVVFDIDDEGAARVASGYGDEVAAVTGDANDDVQMVKAIDAARSMGVLSLVVNIAGGATGGGRIVARNGEPLDKEVFLQTLLMNAAATFNAVRLTARAMSTNEPNDQGERGVVVNTSSIAGLEGKTGQVPYAAGKAAIIGMTLPMARDLAPVGIRVCTIAPGIMGTPLMLSAASHMKSDPTDGIAFPSRPGHPSEFAFLVESIARNPYLNGETVRLDAGLRFTAR